MFEIIIRVKSGKPPELTAPLHDKVLCWGMLEMARKMVDDHKPDAVQTPQADQVRQILAGRNGNS